jgi:hypothetical protein
VAPSHAASTIAETGAGHPAIGRKTSGAGALTA